MEIGDTVLHPRYGVGIIGGIERRVQDGETREYYVIPKPSISSTIFVPVDSAEEVGLRPVASPDTLKQALGILSGECEQGNCGGNLRTLSWSDPLELARAIRKQALEPKSRYPKVSEQHQLKRAKKLLIEEMAVVLGLPEDKVAVMVDGGTEPARGRAATSA
jgi:CarD family transcriptional regulator